MKILVVGSGGREHALVWKLAQEHDVICTPGNPGIAALCSTFDVPASQVEALVSLARDQRVDLVVIGPEDPLIAGLADRFREAGFDTFGPGADGAQLEGSKAFSKELMVVAGVPTARAFVATEADDAKAHAREFFDRGFQVVVKASGAALGKGVVVCDSLAEAEEAIDDMLVHSLFGEAGMTVVIEQRLHGPEFSLITLCSGTEFRSLPVAQDHKRALDGDRGPNTGGMGTYSPLSWVSDELVERTERTIVKPILAELAKRGIDFRGVLFSGLMLHEGLPFCLEYNVRFGDPEIQTLVRRIGKHFGEALAACARGEAIPEIEFLTNAAVSVVLASGGYPGDYPKGIPIKMGELPQNVVAFQAGTKFEDDQLVTNGGRVLCLSASGSTLEEARGLAYAAAETVQFEGKHFRRDIAASALA